MLEFQNKRCRCLEGSSSFMNKSVVVATLIALTQWPFVLMTFTLCWVSFRCDVKNFFSSKQFWLWNILTCSNPFFPQSCNVCWLLEWRTSFFNKSAHVQRSYTPISGQRGRKTFWVVFEHLYAQVLAHILLICELNSHCISPHKRQNTFCTVSAPQDVQISCFFPFLDWAWVPNVNLCSLRSSIFYLLIPGKKGPQWSIKLRILVFCDHIDQRFMCFRICVVFGRSPNGQDPLMRVLSTCG